MNELKYGLEIKDLTIDFGRFKIDKLNLGVKKGCITGLIGRNGAGKSTLIKAITRQIYADEGKVLYNGKTFAEDETGVLGSIACVYDTLPFNMYAKEHNLFALYSKNFARFDTEMYERLMDKFSLPRRTRISKYSFGMQRKYCLILALCQRPDILILDEPTSGVDPYDRNEVTALIQDFMLDENHTVLFSTHITEDLDRIADYIVMMENGKIVLNEDKNTLLESYKLVQCGAMTGELESVAIGVQRGMFGYTFVTKADITPTEGIQIKTPTIEELFVHLTNNAPTDPVLNPIDDVFTLGDNKQ